MLYWYYKAAVADKLLFRHIGRQNRPTLLILNIGKANSQIIKKHVMEQEKEWTRSPVMVCNGLQAGSSTRDQM